VARFVDTMLQCTQEPSSWLEACEQLFFSIEPSDYVEKPEIRTPISDQVDRVPVLFKKGTESIAWVTQAMISNWGVTAEAVEEAAAENLNRALMRATVEVKEIDDVKLGFIGTDLPFKSSLVLAPKLRQNVEPLLGWPLHAVIPDRDFLYLWAAKHTDFLNRVGSVVVREFKSAPYPISTEVFHITDDGIEAIGAFPTA
jgi:hypothetical protein